MKKQKSQKVTNHMKTMIGSICIEMGRYGQIGKLYATELDKYLSYHKLEGQLNKTREIKMG